MTEIRSQTHRDPLLLRVGVGLTKETAERSGSVVAASSSYSIAPSPSCAGSVLSEPVRVRAGERAKTS